MTVHANSQRGETSITIDGCTHLLRPSFEALVAAEDELGSLFTVVEQASQGQLTLAQIAGLFWHCLAADNRPDRNIVGEAVVQMGLVEAAKPLRVILRQIVKGGA